MITKRNFFVIVIIILIVTFLFQFTGVARTALSSYDQNPFYTTPDVANLLSSDRAFSPDAMIAKGDAYAVYVGGSTSEGTGAVARQWAAYTKHKLMHDKSLSKVKLKSDNPEMVIVDAAVLTAGDVDIIRDFCSRGIGVVICGYPSNEIMSDEDMKDVLGILYVEDENVKLHGAYLFEGLLVGGDVRYEALEKKDEKYQDLTMEVPWIHPSAGTKSYMRGIPEDLTVKTEDYPAIIWRNSCGSGYVFVVGNDYMESATGLGILSGAMAEMNDYVIYPIVNAQNLIFADYPYLASENEEVIDKYYSRSTSAVFRDIVWTGMGAILEKSDFGTSCMLSPELDYSDENTADNANLSYYLRLMEEKGIETGISDGNVSEVSITDKLDLDKKFWEENMPDFHFTSFYGARTSEEDVLKALGRPLLRNVQTVVKGYSGEPDIVDYMTDNVTAQRTISNGIEYTYSSDMLVRSIQTALGYTSIGVDMSKVAFPEDESELWENYHDALSKNIITFWSKKYHAFDQTTVTGCDLRIRNFLALNYSDTVDKDTIYLKVTGVEGSTNFMLRLHDQEVKSVEGGSFEELEKNVYIISVDGEDAQIVLKSEVPHFYKNTQ